MHHVAPPVLITSCNEPLLADATWQAHDMRCVSLERDISVTSSLESCINRGTAQIVFSEYLQQRKLAAVLVHHVASP